MSRALIWMCLAAVAAAGQAPPSGGDQACLKCHGMIGQRMKRKVVHGAMKMGCATCHADHRQQRTAASQIAFHLTTAEPALCLTCHEANDKKLVAAHRGQPFQASVCTGCHDAHAAEGAKLLPGKAHGPFAGRQCNGCHDAPQGGKIKLVAKAGELCVRCHTEFKTNLAKYKTVHGLLRMSPDACVDCHNAHATDQASFLKKRLPDLCKDCHATMADKGFVHEPARASCLICHEAHAANVAAGLKMNVNPMCRACHEMNGDSAEFPQEYVKTARKVMLDREGRGHPYIGHPTVDAPKPPSKSKPLNCMSCHTAHDGAQPARFVADVGRDELCYRCHKP